MKRIACHFRPSVSGQAIAELVITLILFLIVVTGMIHFAQLAMAQLDLQKKVRVEAGTAAMDGTGMRDLPEAISDWSPGADRRDYTADDRPIVRASDSISILHGYADQDGGETFRKSRLTESPADLSNDGFSLFQLGLIRRSATDEVPLDPFIQENIYNKPSIRLRETLWMPLMGGLL